MAIHATTVAVVGFGYIGACIGAVLAEKRYRVIGIDNRPEVVEEINRGETSINEPGLAPAISDAVAHGWLSATGDYAQVTDADVIVVTVGTPLARDNKPDMRQIEAAAESIAAHLRPGHNVILKSTLPPFATEQTVRPILERKGLRAGRDFHLSFCPERLAEGRALHEFATIPVVVGGVDAASTTAAAAFWEEALGVKTIPVRSAHTAEMVKLACNLWIDLNVALANELAVLTDAIDVDVLEVIDAANTLPKGQHHVNILAPSIGVGGYCLTKDPWFVHDMGRERGIELRTPVTSRIVNDSMPDFTVRVIDRELARLGKTLSASRVAVLGMAFKSNTGDVRFTPAKGAISLLEASGCELLVCDPWVTTVDAREVTSAPLADDPWEAIAGADCVAFFTGHDDFRRMPIEQIAERAPGALILDGRMYFTREQIDQMEHLGLAYRGIGR
ncbi:MAG: nucleotide sugar dehydrogenase [Erythrobacter sp.]|nr:nucleotide sugar dehydrogenase [Erythrobacter sp.]